MVKASTRRAFLDSPTELPGGYREYATGMRAMPFVSTGSSFGSLVPSKSPNLISAIFDQQSKFESKGASPGSRFETFLNLQRDPNYLVSSKMKVPAGFSQISSLMAGFGD